MFANFSPTLDFVGKQVQTWPTWTNPFEILGKTIQDDLSLNTQTIKDKVFILIEPITRFFETNVFISPI
jgi:hypothetical protein